MANPPRQSGVSNALDSRQAGLRNEQLVLSLLKRHGPLSQAQLRELAGLGSSTMSYIVGRLRDKRLIIEQPGASRRRGAKPILIQIDPRSRFVIGVEIGPSRMLIGLYDFLGSLVETVRAPLEQDRDPRHVADLLEISTRGLLGKHQVAETSVLGLGVTLSGSIAPDGRVELSSPMGWKGVPLRDLLQQRFRSPVTLHSTRVRLLAEVELARRGGDAQPDPLANVLYIHVGNGVGGHAILDGALLLGAGNRAGELGHVVVAPDGPTCGCGNRGCLEALVSGPALARRIRADLPQRRDSRLCERIQAGDIPEEVIRLWGEALAEKDIYASEICQQICQHVSRCAAIAINLYDPQVLILGGYVIEPCLRPLTLAIQERIDREVYHPQARTIDIVPARGGEQALILGAATAVLQTATEIV